MSEALKVYEQLCKDKHIEYNIKQKDLVIELDKFLSGSSRNFIKKLFRYNLNQKKCFYLYGGVGIGKTLIMDLFYDDVNLKEKQRVHFHEFMIDIHDQLHRLRNEKNSRDFIISKLVKGIKSKSNLIFFDEFQVTNIADAMILGHLFEEFFKNNILIHGHTHRPKIHQEKYGTRYVLGDWEKEYYFLKISETIEFVNEKID